MSLDLVELQAEVRAHGRVVRVVIAGHAGSSPREAGAAMLVWAGGQSGTIGGGALEWEASRKALALLSHQGARVERMALGPALGQCCGGAVTLVFETFDMERLAALGKGRDGLLARPVGDGTALPPDNRAPLAIRRLLALLRSGEAPLRTQLVQGWLVERLTCPTRTLWIWGAGHVGRALVSVVAPLPEFDITWVDVARSRFPREMPDRVALLAAVKPGDLVGHAPRDAEHLILTYSHALDLDLCHRLLQRGFATAGLIGSASKWGRFRSRLRALGHADAAISRISCPIGDPRLGKHPQAIAVGVVAALLAGQNSEATETGAGRLGDVTG